VSPASPHPRSAGAAAPWPALILTAGLGTRLHPLSSYRAKAALPIAGTPLIARTLHQVRAAGVTRVVVNLHHRADSITRIVGDGAAFDLDVRYSWEPQVLGSAGGPARAIPLLESDRFFIINGDMITDVDLRALAKRHVDANALVTMAVIDGRPGYNGVIADERAIVSGFGTRPGAFHFIGVQAVNAAAFAGVSVDSPSETVHGFYPSLIAARQESIRVFHSAASYFDIGSARDYLETVKAIARREDRPLDRGVDCIVAEDATLTGTVLWDRVTVGAGAVLTDCVVADDVAVPAGARYSRSALVMGENGLSVHQWNPA
jgi:NDP-sugar pyrophosphorylase family protein